ncbi:hypothetical protein D3C86_1852760 [compost metagenome]
MAEFEQGQGQRHVDQHPRLQDHVVVDDAAAEHAGEQPHHRVADDARQAQPAAADLSGQARANQRETHPEQAARHQRQGREKLAQSVHGRHGNGSTWVAVSGFVRPPMEDAGNSRQLPIKNAIVGDGVL